MAEDPTDAEYAKQFRQWADMPKPPVLVRIFETVDDGWVPIRSFTAKVDSPEGIRGGFIATTTEKGPSVIAGAVCLPFVETIATAVNGALHEAGYAPGVKFEVVGVLPDGTESPIELWSNA